MTLLKSTISILRDMTIKWEEEESISNQPISGMELVLTLHDSFQMMDGFTWTAMIKNGALLSMDLMRLSLYFQKLSMKDLDKAQDKHIEVA